MRPPIPTDNEKKICPAASTQIYKFTNNKDNFFALITADNSAISCVVYLV